MFLIGDKTFKFVFNRFVNFKESLIVEGSIRHKIDSSRLELNEHSRT